MAVVDPSCALPITASFMEASKGQPDTTFPVKRGEMGLGGLPASAWPLPLPHSHRQSPATSTQGSPSKPYLASPTYRCRWSPSRGSARLRASSTLLPMKSKASGRKTTQAPLWAASRTSREQDAQLWALSGVEVIWQTAISGFRGPAPPVDMALNLERQGREQNGL